MIKKTLLAAALAATASLASAQGSLGLSGYQVTGSHQLDILGGMGLEASAVTYARDRGTLFFVGDEGLGVVEVSLTGATIGKMAFNWAGTGSTNNDAEGLTYLGGGVLAVAEERMQDVYKFSYAAGTTLALAGAQWASIGPTVGNVGIEGISYDQRDGSFVAVKQDNPMSLMAGGLNFAVGGGTSSMSVLASGTTSLFGLNSFSDVQTLSVVDAFAGTAAADHLLVLSLDSKKLLEIDRSGGVFGSLDVSGITNQAIEGVTVDQFGRIYLVAEGAGSVPSQLFVLTPVPEPESYALFLAGLGIVAAVARRRKSRQC